MVGYCHFSEKGVRQTFVLLGLTALHGMRLKRQCVDGRCWVEGCPARRMMLRA